MSANAAPAKTEEERQQEAVAAAEAHRAQSAPPETPTDAIIPDAPVKPDHVPDKFWNSETGEVNYEAWSTAHTELETKFHQSGKSDEAPAEDDESSTATTDVAADPRQAAIDAANAAYATDRKLSDSHYEALAAQGLTRPMVDNYIAGVIASQKANDAPAYEAAGGEETYSAMVAWAGEALSDAEIEAYNLQVTSNKPEVVKLAVSAMAKRFQDNAPQEGVRVGGLPPSTNSRMFESKAEMTAAMSAPNPNVKGKTRYETDAAYRQEVQRKIAASRNAGKNIFL